MNKVKALVLTGYGLNCDYETAYALKLAGAKAYRVHINSLIDGTVMLKDFQIMVFVGGFSWGDDHGAGVIQAVRMNTNIGDQILEFIEHGNLVLGICNGFQTLVNMGLLPALTKDTDTEPGKNRSVALTCNDCGNFRDDWVHLKVNTASPCVFTKGLDRLEFPVRHGEGKFYASESVIEELIDNNQIVLRYALPDGEPAGGLFPFNPNGSVNDIAGISDPAGRIFGLMPHPEAFNHWTNHPDWTKTKEKLKRQDKKPDSGPTTGILLFQNAVNYF
ncbi:phosphoribosylformylglycinamidine synthase subunit PurQ / glutaminase [Desulfosarcina sp. BuS5]|uniref:phosphoribosylformylglycinamidine synthase I n=1 Tax=Desulfosarcina sp. BuS5 TaxID=933262 RepID=UPI000488E138|nr:phosphoribosylformylglycinamidine synthase I [Desulfosarcina sp. BuS5]WDN88531.1 phosphoribosylformylglycinamidine synthase subunit PurQ / glutaminase [Desulfosarcina sp. BuS5]